MARFMVKVLLLMCTLLFGILVGIQQAEHGILTLLGVTSFSDELKETEEKDQLEATSTDQPEIYIKRIDGADVEIGYVYEPFSIEQLEEKEEAWQLRKSNNRYSKLGSALGDAVYSISQKGARWFTDQLEKVL